MGFRLSTYLKDGEFVKYIFRKTLSDHAIISLGKSDDKSIIVSISNIINMRDDILIDNEITLSNLEFSISFIEYGKNINGEFRYKCSYHINDNIKYSYLEGEIHIEDRIIPVHYNTEELVKIYHEYEEEFDKKYDYIRCIKNYFITKSNEIFGLKNTVKELNSNDVYIIERNIINDDCKEAYGMIIVNSDKYIMVMADLYIYENNDIKVSFIYDVLNVKPGEDTKRECKHIDYTTTYDELVSEYNYI